MGTTPPPLFLVTGATGFVGSYLVRALLAQGKRVRAFGRNRAALDTLASLGAEAISGDLRDAEIVASACQGARTVFHVGALSAPWGSPHEFVAINEGGTAHVLAGCRRHGVQRMIYVSSPSVTFDSEDCVFQTETAPYPKQFLSPYSQTKAAGEIAVHAAKDDLETVIIRPKAVFGPGDTSLLPRLIRAAEQNRLPQIGDGKNRVDLTYVENVVHALLLASESSSAVGNTYFITNGDAGEGSPYLWSVIRQVLNELSITTRLKPIPLSLALTLATAMEATARVTGQEPPLTRYSTLILARTQTYDITAARQDLGYAPIVSLADGLQRTIAAFAAERRNA